jgi:hypothetical protein
VAALPVDVDRAPRVFVGLDEQPGVVGERLVQFVDLRPVHERVGVEAQLPLPARAPAGGEPAGDGPQEPPGRAGVAAQPGGHAEVAGHVVGRLGEDVAVAELDVHLVRAGADEVVDRLFGVQVAHGDPELVGVAGQLPGGAPGPGGEYRGPEEESESAHHSPGLRQTP